MFSSRQPTSEDLPFNSSWDQDHHSLARFNANCYRRLAYRRMHDHEDCQMLEGITVMQIERVVGIPAVWWNRRYK